MPPSLLLDRGQVITYESAAKKEANIINQLAYVPAVNSLYERLWNERHDIAELTQLHLGLDKKVICNVLPQETWIRGSFNICVLVEVKEGLICRRVVFRCPMPHKLAEARYPGAVDEKLGCEVGAYVWIQKNCSDIRIPHLYGFGFSDNRHFTHQKYQPFHAHLIHLFRSYMHRLLRHPDTLSQYVISKTNLKLTTAYIVLEFIGPETGRTLSETWEEHRGSQEHRKKIFQGMARVLVSLARLPQPRIGSFKFRNDGTISLTNRPLLCDMVILENDGAPQIMRKDETYTCTEAFTSDLLTFHDGHFRIDPNAVYNDADCRGNMGIKILLRAISHHFIRKENRNGPFLLQFTDFHASNVLVDKEWNLTCLLDLEWAPYWLTGCALDEIDGDHIEEYDQVRREFISIVEEEERKTATKHDISIARIMQQKWETKGVWFWYCLRSMTDSFWLVKGHTSPKFSTRWSSSVEQIFSLFWSENSEQVVEQKVADHKKYDEELKLVFKQAAVNG
ncbi:predicted protein [Uncinocarpus reesii 1704]|uniref:Aminoglycoside phosphotransferase domain-containing protein n=1 Tax=Uncinocarpus reesii (strain UAMH 1704) TaxID=336963 RepID=C4JVU5_UNCRE|nr:uncharacterized protein UREG_06687 [Uncinocarpus reesii 1704]EEP81822.1 predicted protein [Uncinocarpus reesii 1704]